MKNEESGNMCEIEHKITTRKVLTLQGSEEPVLQEIYLRAKCETKEDCLHVADRFFGQQEKVQDKKIKRKKVK